MQRSPDKGRKNYDPGYARKFLGVLGFLYDRLWVLDPDRTLRVDNTSGNAVKKPGILMTVIGLCTMGAHIIERGRRTQADERPARGITMVE